MGSLLATTLLLLKQRSKTLPQIAEETKLPFYWLRKLSTNEIDDPGVNRIQVLFEYLSSTKLIKE